MHVFDRGDFAQGGMSKDSLQAGLNLLRFNTSASMESPMDIQAQIQASRVHLVYTLSFFLNVRGQA